ncbi:MAG: ion transporter [Verrucomicrobiota bacterium]
MTFREKTRRVIFGSETTLGKLFDVILIILILDSVIAVMLASVGDLQEEYGEALRIAEWVFTGIFTLEYFVRIWCSEDRRKYLTSFFGIVDLLAIVPTYLSLFIGGAEFLIVIRILRAVRLFRILKLIKYIQGENVIMRAFKASRYKITVFIVSVISIVTIIGAIMHLVEGPENGFVNIPISVYWAIVTLTTVGYGDIHPQTPAGQIIASFVMLLGFAIIAVPTGIVTAEIAKTELQMTSQKSPPSEERLSVKCNQCSADNHANDAKYCRVCGSLLERRLL